MGRGENHGGVVLFAVVLRSLLRATVVGVYLICEWVHVRVKRGK